MAGLEEETGGRGCGRADASWRTRRIPV